MPLPLFVQAVMYTPTAKRAKTDGRVSTEQQRIAEQLKIGPNRAGILIAKYGYGNVVETMRQNPYQPIIDGVEDIGVRTCDQVADTFEVPKTSPIRISGRIYQSLSDNEKQGHCGQAMRALMARINQQHKHPKALLNECICMLHDKKAIEMCRLDGELYILRRSLFVAECQIALVLKRLTRNTPPPWASWIDPDLIHSVGNRIGVTPSADQVAALQVALKSNVMLINGGAGTGKTTLMKLLLAALETVTACLEVRLVAPTGLAADRLAQVTNMPAMTVHRSLGMDWDKRSSYPLMILDEATMAGTALCHSLLKCVPWSCVVIFVGDEGQLCPVQPGAVFHSLLRCPMIPSYTLREVHRQAGGSSINNFASGIRQGDMPEGLARARADVGDVWFIDVNNPTQGLEKLKYVITEYLPSCGWDPLRDVQVLTLKKDGQLGVKRVNNELQGWVNPDAKPMVLRGVEYRLGDRLLNSCNDYERQVMNGNIGTLVAITKGDDDDDDQCDQLRVQFGDRTVSFCNEHIDQLELAYCLNVHKSQGSEFRAVVFLMLENSGSPMLRRNLLYTACTRAVSKLIIISNESKLREAINKTEARLTGPSVLRKQLYSDDKPEGDDDSSND